MGLIVTFFLGIFILAGAALAEWTKEVHIAEQIAVSIAFGTMSALAILELIPEAIEHVGSGQLWILPIGVLGGILILKILDHFIPDHDHAHGFSHDCSDKNVIHIGMVSAIAVTLHNIIEGMAVYSIAEQSLQMGMLMALGVGLHNIPMGMVIDATLQKEKQNRKVALLLVVSLSTFFGGIIMKLLWAVMNDLVVGVLMTITIGMLVYIVLFELVPHLMHAKNKALSVAGAIFGVLIIIVSTHFGH